MSAILFCRNIQLSINRGHYISYRLVLGGLVFIVTVICRIVGPLLLSFLKS